MRYDEAAAASELKLGVLATKIQGRQEIYDQDSNSFFIKEDGQLPDDGFIISRKIGRGSRNSNDWLPSVEADVKAAIEQWKANQEGRNVIIEKPWDMACMSSPVNRAFRIKADDGLLMIRTADKSTWSEMLGGTLLSRVSGPFKSYDGWEPMPADHFFATTDLSGEQSIRLGDQGRLGRKAYVVPHRDLPVTRATDADISIKKKKKPPFPNATVAKVRDETFGAAAVISQSLATAIGSTTGENQKTLVEELKRLASHVSWHLREDRSKYQNRGTQVDDE